MLQELTVRENIAYSARVRLPHSWPRQEIEDFVDIVLEALDLSHVADNLIDSVSGGQRKRVNIGMELVTCPSAIFLDEPTSGLDATAAMKIANTMKKIAIDIGISVVAVIHQPRYEIFSEFDDLLMIAPGGLTAYLGQRKDIQPYFENLGFYFDVRHNPADILMDTLSGKGRRVDIKPLPGEDVDSEERKRFEMELEQKSKSHQYIGYDVAELVYAWKCREDAMSALNLEQELLQKADSSGLVDEPPPVPELPPEIYVTEFDQELLRQSVLEQGSNCGRSGFESCRTSTEKSDGFGQVDQVIAADFVVSEKETSKQEPSMTMRLPHTECELDFQHSTLQRACMERGANWFSQLAFAHNRSVTQQYRRCNAFALELLVALISGSIMGLAVMCYDGSLYQGLLVQPFSLISPAPVEVVIPLLALIIGCTIGLSGAPAGTKIFSEEKDVYWREASAGHNPFSYFMGKNVSATYRFFVSALHFTASFHILTCPNIAFWNLYVIHLSMFYTVYGISFIVAMIVKRENASMVAVCVIIVFAVLCGNGPNLKDARKWGFEWFLDMSFNRWAAEAWYSEELLIYDGVYEIWKVSTEHFGFTLNRFWTDIFWIVVIGCAARLLAFILLVLLNRQKQR
jgi:ABC-type multidrug transport system ATPase subunit